MKPVMRSSTNSNSRSELHYHINVLYSEEDGGWIADIPDLAHCSAFGESPEEALREVQIAKAAWIQAAEETGKPIPPPQYRPVIYQTAS
jgi:predicted RNase H-like HicB family nuclease